jgi:hypothetical protein
VGVFSAMRRRHSLIPNRESVGGSQRVISYDETKSQQPLGALLADLATVLKVSATSCSV